MVEDREGKPEYKSDQASGRAAPSPPASREGHEQTGARKVSGIERKAKRPEKVKR